MEMWKVASPQRSLPALYLLVGDIEITGFGGVGRPLTAVPSSRTCEAVTRPGSLGTGHVFYSFCSPLIGSNMPTGWYIMFHVLHLLVGTGYFIDVDCIVCT